MININLVPNEIKEKISQMRKTASAIGLSTVIVIVLIVISVLIKATDLILLQPELKGSQEKLAIVDKSLEQYEPFQNKALEINERLDIIEKIDQKRPRWSILVPTLISLIPSGITINNLSINAVKSPNFILQGEAKNQDVVVDLKNKLGGSQYFKNVLLKNSSISTTTDNEQNLKQKVDFTFEFDAEYLGPIPDYKENS